MATQFSYLLDRSTGDRLRVNGCIRSHETPPLAKQYATTRFSCGELPERVDLREFLSPVEDQGQVGSCTANALAGAYEYLVRRQSGDQGDVSRLFLYFNARKRDNIQGDQGSRITTSIRVLQEMGICRESIWGYDPARVNDQPSAEAYQDAQYFRVQEAEQISIDLFAMKHCLAEGYPFAFGIKLFESFNQASRGGVVPMPSDNEAARPEHGLHAMLCVGYSDQAQAFVVRNSWSERWGDRGYCYIPYDYLANSNYSFDFWTVHTISDPDLTPGIWMSDREPLFDAANLDAGSYEFVEFEAETVEAELEVSAL